MYVYVRLIAIRMVMCANLVNNLWNELNVSEMYNGVIHYNYKMCFGICVYLVMLGVMHIVI